MTRTAARLLIVDDEVAQMRALCDTLGSEGYAAQGFSSARQALNALRAGEFDLALLFELNDRGVRFDKVDERLRVVSRHATPGPSVTRNAVPSPNAIALRYERSVEKPRPCEEP